MFRLSKRLFAKEWLKFFTQEKPIQLDYMRCFKDTSEPYRIYSTFLESYETNYTDMNCQELLKALSVSSYVDRYVKRKLKDRSFLSDFYIKLHKRIEIDKDIEWTPENIINYLKFANKNRVYRWMFQKSSTDYIIKIGLEKLNEFSLQELCTFGNQCRKFDIAAHNMVQNTATEKFNQQNSFDHWTTYDFICLIRTVLLKRDSNFNKIPVDQSNFNREALDALIKAFMKKMKFPYNRDRLIAAGNEGFSNLIGPIKANMLNLLADKIAIEVDIENQNVSSFEFSQPDRLIQVLRNFDYKHSRGKDLFYQITTKIFVSHIFNKSNIVQSIKSHSIFHFINTYLEVAAKFEIFQLVFLDLIVSEMQKGLNNPRAEIEMENLCRFMHYLAILNYPDRFNSTMPHTEHQLEIWQNVLEKSEELLLKSLSEIKENEELEKEEEESDNEDDSYSGLILEYLWAYCVFDRYSKPLIEKCISASVLNPEELQGEKNHIMMQQISIWLKHEHGNEYCFSRGITDKMADFKYNYDKQEHKSENSPLKEAIKTTLQLKKIDFIENHSEFPYVFDFAVKKTKKGLMIGDESSFLEGSDGIIKSGFNKVMDRQLNQIGWDAKKVDLKTWLKIGKTDIFT
ncbi:unnamed protein product [Blepharisma stoltei]|uniref:Uncharacterized protein n=1 Tax=Blepharisma stoltei TaxID=1481888 RepID=A0AAU9IYZ9_9CILI|nr:unnamed protein product [Blepharisma stoltei]